MVYTEIRGKERKAVISHGLFNQMYSLFLSVELAKRLGRGLVVGPFYVHYMDLVHCTPLSRVIHLPSLGVPTMDWYADQEPTPSRLVEHTYEPPPQTLEVLAGEEAGIVHLEMGCLFNLSLPDYSRTRHVQGLRFHPLFYELTSSFRQTYPAYQVVHYRMENDFCAYFHRRFQFGSMEECQADLFRSYNRAMKQYLDPNLPTLVVSHYYKDPHQNRAFDLPWKNLVHFSLTPQQRDRVCDHLGISSDIPMREVDALLDFILGTSPNVRFFIGCGLSTFSETVEAFWGEKNCFLIRHKDT
jgi:hypothetical protein